MKTPQQGMTVGALAAAAGVGVETVRFYQRERLLNAPARSHGSIRRYGEADLQRLAFIKAAKGLGFSLGEITELLALQDAATCGQARTVAQARLADVRQKLADLGRMESALAALVDSCGSDDTQVSCPIIDALYATAGVKQGALLTHAGVASTDTPPAPRTSTAAAR